MTPQFAVTSCQSEMGGLLLPLQLVDGVSSTADLQLVDGVSTTADMQPAFHCKL